MKNFMVLSAVALAFSVTPVLAEDAPRGPAGHMFEKHDTNADGVVSKDEFLKSAEERFSTIDTDGNGEISQEEAKAGHEKMREKMKEFRGEREERRNAPQDAPIDAPADDVSE